MGTIGEIASGLTAEHLREMVDYDPLTGVLRWRGSAAAWRNGRVAGCYDPQNGYVLVRLAGRLFKGHRLAWLYMTGQWPASGIDHINGARSDNRWSNLRAATHGENACNRGAQKNSRTGIKGVHRQAGKWRARIKVGGRNLSLGLFSDPLSAAEAYAAAARRYHGDFARRQ